jgi:Golgi phosphoprotein 3 (GPP34)
MDELGEDLLLLAARPDGTLPLPDKLRFGLSGAELVRLAAAGRVDIVRGRIAVLDPAPTGDPLLDEALASMAGRRREPTAKAWVALDRSGHVERFLARAEAAGFIRSERRERLGFIPVTRWVVADTARAAQARARLEAVAASTGPVDLEQAALAGLAYAIDLERVVFPGWAGAPARKRLRQLAKGGPVTADVTTAAAGGDAAAAASAAAMAAAGAAVSAASQAAVSAATAAATAAAASAAADAGAHGAHHH